MDQAPVGWAAIDEAIAPLYPGSEPQHWGTVIRFSLGGPDPLDGTSAYDAGDHWHYVTYGMTELYDKESEDPEVNGWGFEFTFRLAKGGTTEAPVWPVALMQNLARYVFQTGNVFEAGHHMTANGPIAVDVETALTGMLFARDPQLSEPVRCSHGSFEFIQVVGITDDELDAVQSWNGAGTIELLRQRSPMLVTDLSRASFMADPEYVQSVEDGRRSDGSSTGGVFTDQLGVTRKGGFLRGRKRLEITLGALAVQSLTIILPGRIPFDRPFTLATQGGALQFEPGTPGAEAVEDGAIVQLDAETTERFAATLKAQRGTYEVEGLPNVVFKVVPSYITGHDGEVSGVVG